MERKIAQSPITSLWCRLWAILVALLFSPALALAEDFTCGIVGVHDGDTITVMRQGRGERMVWGLSVVPIGPNLQNDQQTESKVLVAPVALGATEQNYTTSQPVPAATPPT